MKYIIIAMTSPIIGAATVTLANRITPKQPPVIIAVSGRIRAFPLISLTVK